MLTEEVADTALGLILCTVREFPQAERYLRAGKWVERAYPLTKATLRDRNVGMVGMGAIGQAIARRLDAMKVPVVYHSRRPAAGVGYRYYPKLIDMARDVDILVAITPGGPETQEPDQRRRAQGARAGRHPHQHGARLGGRRAGADRRRSRTRPSCRPGSMSIVNEPEVPAELIAMENVVLFPHLGSASVYTRTQMDQLVVDNLAAWAAGKPPLTPVPETPWPPRVRHGGRMTRRGRPC